ncbi:unnamed protein product [Albugo candida]|uniref:Uncharacterized protein n=1 Tax=Albugo candida TaxID=65357 RepID=A0A024G3H2_9STRA|nr:unnamed protein product [Albugo candida]|eukprot:CCI41310.1 unnamed protein product [Albugo candida]
MFDPFIITNSGKTNTFSQDGQLGFRQKSRVDLPVAHKLGRYLPLKDPRIGCMSCMLQPCRQHIIQTTPLWIRCRILETRRNRSRSCAKCPANKCIVSCACVCELLCVFLSEILSSPFTIKTLLTNVLHLMNAHNQRQGNFYSVYITESTHF